MKIGVIILAGGSSVRMNGVNKQFASLCGKPVIMHAVGAFLHIEAVKEIAVVVSEGLEADYKELLGAITEKPLKIVTGGKTRALSAKNGFLALSDDCTVIAVHDGARPLADQRIIRAVLDDGEKYGAAICAVKSKDTVKISENGFIAHTPDRDRVYNAQTPQAFSRENYEKMLGGDLLRATDDASLAEALGIRVKITEGSYENIKITTPEDVVIAQKIMEERL